MHTQPLIGITTGGEGHLPNKPELYLQAVERAGASAAFIGPRDDLPAVLERYDGFIIPGGRDVDPLLYNEKKMSDTTREDAARMRFDRAIIHGARHQGKPLLGICYGMQLMNVALGGSLYQDIGKQIGDMLHHREKNHEVRVDRNPFLRAGHYEVNSSHHQALKRIGMGLKAFAFAPDGVAEALYALQAPFLLGVQWHPERMSGDLSRSVFSCFTEACGEHP